MAIGAAALMATPFSIDAAFALPAGGGAAAAVAPALGPGTLKLLQALKDAGPTIGSRIDAASAWAAELTAIRPEGGTLKIAISQMANGVVRITGRGREILLYENGVTVINGAVNGVWKVLTGIEP